MVSVYVIILYKLHTLSISISAQKELNKCELPPTSTPLVIESIGTVADRDTLKLCNWIVFVFVCLPPWLRIDQWVKATAVEFAALKSE